MIINFCGDSERWFVINGKRYYYKFHPYLGVDYILNNKRKEIKKPPKIFWDKIIKLAEQY